MRADEIIALARDLARREAGKPRSVSLRRAASSAYYALFHTLAALCADTLVGRRPWRLYTPVYRSLDHGRSRSVLNTLRAKGAPTALIAVSFAALQDARHEADYNPEPFPFNRSDILDLIDGAERAIAVVDDLSPDEKLDLAIKLVFKTR